MVYLLFNNNQFEFFYDIDYEVHLAADFLKEKILRFKIIFYNCLYFKKCSLYHIYEENIIFIYIHRVYISMALLVILKPNRASTSVK